MVLLHNSMHLHHTHALPDLCLLIHHIDAGNNVNGQCILLGPLLGESHESVNRFWIVKMHHLLHSYRVHVGC